MAHLHRLAGRTSICAEVACASMREGPSTRRGIGDSKPSASTVRASGQIGGAGVAKATRTTVATDVCAWRALASVDGARPGKGTRHQVNRKARPEADAAVESAGRQGGRCVASLGRQVTHRSLQVRQRFFGTLPGGFTLSGRPLQDRLRDQGLAQPSACAPARWPSPPATTRATGSPPRRPFRVRTPGGPARTRCGKQCSRRRSPLGLCR